MPSQNASLNMKGSIASSERDASPIVGNGEMARRTREHDWALTALGPLSSWSEAMIVTVNSILVSPVPTALLVGPEFLLLYNDAYRPFLSSRHPEFFGQRARDAWHASWHMVRHRCEAAFQKGETTYERDQLIPTAVNDRVEDLYWTYCLSPIYDRGRVFAVLNLCQDVTANVHGARQLRESEARSARILESIGDAVIVTDAETRITIMNEVAEELTGWNRHEALGQPLMHVLRLVDESTRIPPPDPAGSVPGTGALNGLPVNTILLARDGRERSISDSIAPIRTDAGEMVGIVLVFRDITEQRQGEQTQERMKRELEENYAELQVIYDTSPVALAMIDPTDFRYVRGNAKLAEILGKPIEDIVGTPVLDLAADVSGLRNSLEQAASGTHVIGKVLEGELANDTGTRRVWQADYAPVFSPSGKVEMIAASSTEITAQRQIESSVRQSEKLAAVGRLAASIAHEINNPLEAVTNLLYLARVSEQVPEIYEYLDMAERELRRVAAISSQTLRFYRQSTSATRVTCRELVQDVLSIYQGRLHNSGIRVERHRHSENAVTCLEGEIRQVFSNLIGNAIDAMPSSGGRLLLRSRDATHWPTGRKGLMMTVADNGAGMDPAVQKRIFEAFFTTKGIGGTGLGLWISQEIIERHAGQMRVRSSRGGAWQGTIFNIFLPFGSAIAS